MGGVVAMSPVDELVHQGAAFARVGDAPVDEHGVRGQAVDAVQFAGQTGRCPRAGRARPDRGPCASARSSCAATTGADPSCGVVSIAIKLVLVLIGGDIEIAAPELIESLSHTRLLVIMSC